MKLTVIPIVIGALGTVTKGLLKVLGDMEIRGRVETVQAWKLEDEWRLSKHGNKKTCGDCPNYSIIEIG